MRLLLLLLVALAIGCAPVEQSSALVHQLEAKAEAGNAEAAYHAGMLYHLGDGVGQDFGRAFKHFRNAAEAGDALGAYKVGCYYAGQGGGVVQPNAALALQYKLIAARAGYVFAQADLGMEFLAQGKTEEALPWLEAAAAQGNHASLLALADLHNDPASTHFDPVKAYASFKVALSLSDDRNREEGKAWLANLAAGFSAEQQQKAEAAFVAMQPNPTALTKLGMQGRNRAEAVARGS